MITNGYCAIRLSPFCQIQVPQADDLPRLALMVYFSVAVTDLANWRLDDEACYVTFQFTPMHWHQAEWRP